MYQIYNDITGFAITGFTITLYRIYNYFVSDYYRNRLGIKAGC